MSVISPMMHMLVDKDKESCLLSVKNGVEICQAGVLKSAFHHNLFL